MMFKEKLEESAKKYNNILCMGLDPVVEQMPEQFRKNGISGFSEYFARICEKMKERNVTPAAFKPNLGFYTVHDNPFEEDFSGSTTLGEVVRICAQEFEDVPVILDSKRGDINKSNANYIKQDLKISDALTLHSYLGTDSITPMKEFARNGAYILVRTSNPSGHQVQNLGEGEVYKNVARLVQSWSDKRFSSLINENIGMVVGATQPKELEFIVENFPRTPLLIPGVGSQGGSAQDILEILRDYSENIYHHRFNSSSGITHPWAKQKEDAPSNAVEIAVDKIEEYIGICKPYM